MLSCILNRRAVFALLWFLAVNVALAASPAMPVIPSTVFNVTDYGAIGDASYDNTTNIQAAINAANAAGGGVVEFPAGTYLSGPITLLSTINLRLDAGAMLQALPFGTYPGGATNAQTFIGCNSIHDLEISGTGTIDGQGAAWWVYNATNNTIVRPMMLNLYSVNRLFIHDITFQNPANHHCGLRNYGGNITISNLTVATTNNSPNTDGLNFVGTNSIIENCHISDGDDNIAMGSTGPIYDLLITNCTFGYGHGVSIGSGITGITNLTVINCSFTGTGNGIRVKCARDNSLPMKNLNYLNLSMTNVGIPFVLYSYYDIVGTPDRIPFTEVLAASNTLPVNGSTPIWRDILFSNINVVSASDIGGIIWGPTEMPVSNITFIHVTNNAPKTFDLYNVHGVKVIDSKFNFASGPTFTLCNGDVTVSNSLSGTALVMLSGAPATNGFALYNATASLTNADAFAASPITVSASILTVSNNFSPSANTVFNFAPGTNAATVVVKGNLTLAGTNNILAGPGFTNGTYTLMTCTGTLGGTLPVLGSVPAGYNCVLNTNTAKQLKLVVTLAGPQPPAPPANLTATASNSVILLNWSPAATATNYNVKRSLASGGLHTTIASLATTNYSDTQVTNGTTYYYVVSAVDSVGESPDSSEVSATLSSPPTNSGAFADTFGAGTVDSSSPAAPTPTSTSYQVLSSKTWSPGPGIATNHLTFGIGATSSGCIEAQALFTTTPIVLATPGDTISFTVTFTNTAGLLTGSSTLGFGLYNSGQNGPVPGGLNGNMASGSIANATGNAQIWVGYLGQLAYTGANSQIVTRPAQTGTGNNNQDCATTGSSASYSNPVGATIGTASATPSLALTAGNPYTEVLTLTLTAANTLAITNSFYGGTDTTNGAILSQFGGVASGSGFVTNSFDAFAIGWRESGSQATAIDINKITIAATLSTPAPGAPANFTAAATNLLINLAWTPVTSATNYNLKRGTVSGAYPTVIGITGTNYADAGVTDAVTYYYVVSAVSAGGESTNSPQVSATTLPSNVPTNLDVQPSGNFFRLSWPADHLGWRLQIQTNNLAPGLSTNWVTVPNSTNVIATNLLVDPANRSVFLRLVYP